MKTILLQVLIGCMAVTAAAQNCQQNSIGVTALSDMATSVTYQGFQGGLYPGGAAERPELHEQRGLEAALGVVPRDWNGLPNPNGRIGFVGIGASNTAAQFGAFEELAAGDPLVNPVLVMVNGGQGGQSAELTSDPDAQYWNTLDYRVSLHGLTNEQVQVAWFLQVAKTETTDFPEHALELQRHVTEMLKIAKQRFPNLAVVYISSRVYGGYSTSPLHPEPLAFESAFGLKWLIESQISGTAELNSDPDLGPVVAPWISWGPYTWADGLLPRTDGWVWECDDFAGDGTHTTDEGAAKVGSALLGFFKQDVTAAPWFRDPDPSTELLLTQRDLHPGEATLFEITGANAGEPVFFLASWTGLGSGTCYDQIGGLCLDLNEPVVVFGAMYADATGTAQRLAMIPVGTPTDLLHTQGVALRGPSYSASGKSNTITAPVLP